MLSDTQCLSIAELEALGAQNLSKMAKDYFNEGADSGETLSQNILAYRKYRIRPRVLRDVSEVDSSVNVFGFRSAAPFGIAPAAMQCLAHVEGELATARACRSQNLVMGLSSFSTKSLEDVRDASGHIPNVLQLYLFEQRAYSEGLIKRAKAAGYKAVVLTVDTSVLGRRNLEVRNDFKLPSHLKTANFTEISPISGKSVAASIENGKRTLPEGPVTFHSHGPNPTLTWENSIGWLKKVAYPMQVWIKGVMAAEDAVLAVSYGLDGIIVSNHGGRQLDGGLATIDALPEIAAAVKGQIPIHIDGGLRKGTDIFKALALGADFCWVGRPVLWGLAWNGQAGVEHGLRLLAEEFRRCMSLAGVTKVSDIHSDFLRKADREGFISKL